MILYYKTGKGFNLGRLAVFAFSRQRVTRMKTAIKTMLDPALVPMSERLLPGGAGEKE